MRVLILAAGRGQRLSPLTNSKPKCLVTLGEKSLLEHSLLCLRQAGLKNISLVTGYAAKKLAPFGLPCFHNSRWQSTNMLFSMMTAMSLLDGKEDLLIVYSDILFSSHVLGRLLACESEFSTVVDKNWYELWNMRMAHPLHDAETLKLNKKKQIIEISNKPDSMAQIQGQYIGLSCLRKTFHAKWKWHFEQLLKHLPDQTETMSMTAFFQSLIQAGHLPQAVITHGGWLEIDTVEDRALYSRLLREGTLQETFGLQVR